MARVNVARIQPAGSMVDKTAIWRWRNGDVLEFDFLPVLNDSIEFYSRVEEQNVFQNLPSCLGCIELVKAPVDIKRLGQCYVRDIEYKADTLKDKEVLNKHFVNEINRNLTSSCNCFAVRFEKGNTNKNQK